MVFLRKILLPEIYRDLEVAELKQSETEGLALVPAGAA
jgi:hypothetical protein